MLLLIFFLTMSLTLGKLQKIRDQVIINQIDDTNKLVKTNPLIIPSNGQEGKNAYPFYKPNNDVKITKRNSKSEQFEQKKDSNILNTIDKTTEEENDYKLTTFNDDLGRSYSNELKEVNNAKQIKEVNDSLESRRSRMMILRRPRVCYACSSINDPSCWSPSNNTIVKYCREPNISCLSKTFQYEGIKHIIRDCGSTCTDKASLEPDLVYKLCKTCHYDLCNSAYTMKIQIITIFSFILFNIVHSY